MPHKPVLVREVLTSLGIQPGWRVVDGTIGSGGHALAILEAVGSAGKLIGLDQDPSSIERCRQRLKEYPQASLFVENFMNLGNVLDFLNIPEVDAVILDIGMCSDQLEDAGRGFSYERTGPLDMRMSPRNPLSARELVRDLSQEELERLFWEYGNESQARRIARRICDRRKTQRIETTDDLVRIVEEALPYALRFQRGRRPVWSRRHPATRVFQALRIAVNRELETLEQGLPPVWKRVRGGGRFGVITFHSLEDRIVKNTFREWMRQGEALGVTKKPLVPSRQEVTENPRSRSAKLRTVEKRK